MALAQLTPQDSFEAALRTSKPGRPSIFAPPDVEEFENEEDL